MAETWTKKGWPRAVYGDVVRKVSDRVDVETSALDRYVAGEHMDTDDLRIRRWGTIGDGYLGPAFHMRFKPGQVLYGSRRTYLRKVAVPDFEGITANTTFVLEPKDPNVLLPELLPFIMQTESFHEHSIKQSKGSVNPYINFSDLAWYEFALPPLNEQSRIADTLHKAMAVRESTLKLESSARRALLAVSAKEFEDVLTTTNDMTSLVDICSRKPQNGVYKSEGFRGRGVPMIGMRELFGHEVIEDNLDADLVDLTPVELKRFELTPSDLLFGRRSVVLEGAGKCIRVGAIAHPAVFESSVLRVTIDRSIADSRYVFEWFQSPKGHQQIRRIVTFTTVSGVAGSDVSRLPVPLPSLEVQRRIADRLSNVREQLLVLVARKRESSELARSVIERVLEPVYDLQ